MKKFKNLNASKCDICINWDFITICQLHCFYCYSRKNKKNWNRIQTFSNIIKIIDSFKCNKTIEINVLGGEPTLHPKFVNIINELCEVQNIKVVNIFTNGLLNNKLRDLNTIKNKDKITVLHSYHPSEISPDDFIRSIDLSNTFKQRIHLMFPADRYYSDVEKIYTTFKKTIPVVCHYVTINDITRPISKNIQFYEDEFMYNNKHFTVSEFIKHKLNYFKGWMCNKNTFDIDIFGNISNMCENLNKNVLDYPYFFKELKNLTQRCNRIVCSNACWLESNKWL